MMRSIDGQDRIYTVKYSYYCFIHKSEKIFLSAANYEYMEHIFTIGKNDELALNV